MVLKALGEGWQVCVYSRAFGDALPGMAFQIGQSLGGWGCNSEGPVLYLPCPTPHTLGTLEQQACKTSIPEVEVGGYKFMIIPRYIGVWSRSELHEFLSISKQINRYKLNRPNLKIQNPKCSEIQHFLLFSWDWDHSVAQILLPPPLECWDCRYEPW